MAFSYEAAQDVDQCWLLERLRERVAPTDFVFHFMDRPLENPQVCYEILSELGLPSLTPYIRIATFRAGA